jgi:hypothetical protein
VPANLWDIPETPFYRYQIAVNTGGGEVSPNTSRRKPNFKNRVEEEAEQAVAEFGLSFTAHG